MIMTVKWHTLRFQIRVMHNLIDYLLGTLKNEEFSVLQCCKL